jgi:hypothetical protein
MSKTCWDKLANTIFEQDEYSILNSKHFIGIHGYMLVYSVASTQSFEMVQVIRDKILNHLVSQCEDQNGDFSFTDAYRALNGFLSLLLATRATYAQTKDKSQSKRERHWQKSSTVHTLKPVQGTMRTLPKPLR